jgi:DNA-binding MarR family transcriptional regulator
MEGDMRAVLDETEFASIRPADGKVFMMISRQVISLSEYAKMSGISRQSIHKSLLRLVDFGVIELVQAPNSKRDKVPVVTEKGQELHAILFGILHDIEQKQIAKVGKERFEAFKSTLMMLVDKS